MDNLKNIKQQNTYLRYKKDSYTYRAISLVLFTVISLIIIFDLLVVFPEYYFPIWVISGALLIIVSLFLVKILSRLLSIRSQIAENKKKIKRLSDEDTLREKIFG